MQPLDKIMIINILIIAVISIVAMVINAVQSHQIKELTIEVMNLRSRIIDLENAVFEDDDPPDPGEEQSDQTHSTNVELPT